MTKNTWKKAVFGMIAVAAYLIISVSAQAQTTLSATEDTYVRDGTYAGSNYGTATTLQTKMADAGTSYTRYTYVKFNISTISGTVSSAKLKLYGKVSATTGVTATHAYAVTDDTWTEGGMTWNNKPAVSGSSLANLSISSMTAAWYEWDVTSFVASEKTAGQTVVSLVVKNDLNCNGNNDFQSSEASSNQPQLVVTTGGNASPTVSLTSPTSGTAYTAPASIAMAATAADSDGTVSKVEFYGGTTLLSSDTSNPYNATWASVAAGTYSLTAKAFDNLNASTTSSAVSVTVNAAGGCGNGTGPTDNPVATKYGSTAYPWTDNLKWTCVYLISNYSGATEVDKFNAARDAATAAGGGVVYYPSGTYTFTDSIYLKNGVVIRGANPSTSDAKVSGYAPPTKLNFPKYNQSLSGTGTANSTAFKYISTVNTNTDSNIGVVNVDINRASFKVVAGDAATQNNKNIVVFGIRNNNVAEPDSGIPTTWQNAWQRWSYRFACNVKLMGYQNILVANNRINDAITDNYEQPNYLVKNGTTIVTLTAGSQAVFNYGNHYGIDINRAKPGGYSLAGTPTSEPTLFRTGNVVRDNYVYHTMRIAITASGQGLQIKDNMIRDLAGKYAYVDPTGKNLVSNSATLENRAIDWSGHSVAVTGNDYEVRQHNLKNAGYYSVDGEGILLQECCGGSTVSGVTISNNYGPATTYIGLYKVRNIANAVISGNTINTSSLSNWPDSISVIADTNGGPYQINNSTVSNNSVVDDISFDGEATGYTGTGNSITGNTTSSGAVVKHACEANATVSGNTGLTVNACH